MLRKEGNQVHRAAASVVELLEARRLLSVGGTTTSGGTLRIATGPPVEVTVSDAGICSITEAAGDAREERIEISWVPASADRKGYFFVTANGQLNPLSGKTVHGFRIFAGDGNDTVQFKLPAKDMFRALHNTIYGGAGNDMIIGSAGKDRVYGGDGDDTIAGGGAADRIYGDDDDDVINAGSGNDHVWGGAGNDTIAGGSGRNRLYGNDGTDRIAASAKDIVDDGDGSGAAAGAIAGKLTVAPRTANIDAPADVTTFHNHAGVVRGTLDLGPLPTSDDLILEYRSTWPFSDGKVYGDDYVVADARLDNATHDPGVTPTAP